MSKSWKLFRIVRQSTASWEGDWFGAYAYTNIGTTVDLGTTSLNTVVLFTTYLNTVDLGTTTLNTVHLGTTTLNTFDLGTTSTGAGFEMTGAVMGVTEASHDGNVDDTLLSQMKPILLL